MKKQQPGRKSACAFIRSHLISVTEGNSTGETSPDIREHLDSCEECAILVQRFARGWESLAAPEAIRPGPSFFPDLIGRIEAYEKPGSGLATTRSLAWRILRPVAVTALFLGGILAGHELGKAEKPLSRSEDYFAAPSVDIFENIPQGSVAHYYVDRQNAMKEDFE